MKLYNELSDLTKQLIRINSISGSKNNKGEYNENIIADFIIDYFKKHNISSLPIVTSDGRKCVCVFKKGSSKRTIVLIAHHDTVGIDDYQGLNALDPDDLAKKQINQKFIFGRGSGDMKSGIAVGIHTLIDLYKENLETNIIFLCVPDEENASMGIKTAGKYLNTLKNKEKLNYIGLINLDCVFQDTTSNNVKTIIAGGAIGKLLPSFYVFGKSTHASSPFDGISSNTIASRIVENLDSNSKFSDKNRITGEYAPPPTCLKFQDLKEDYNVQLPLKTYLYFNYLTFHETAADVLKKMKKVAYHALEKALKDNQKKYASYSKMQQKTLNKRKWDRKITIYNYTTILRIASRNHINIHGEIKEIKEKYNNLDLREQNFKIVQLVANYARLQSPYVICFFSPPYYPSSYSNDSPFIKTIKKQVELFAKRENINIQIKDFCEGVSDMNYMQIDKKTLSDVKQYIQNNPLSHIEMEFDPHIISSISMPIVDIGPYAFNPHQYDEKVDIEYTFFKLPKLLKEVIYALQQ